MTEPETDHLRTQVEAWVGKPMSTSGPSVAPDDVNLPMIRHWVDAFDDHDRVYLDEAFAATTRFGGIVAPPAMLQTWTMARPQIEGIAARGGAAAEIQADSPLGVLIAGGFTGTLATNSELEFARYLRLGDRLQSSTALESVSERKVTSLGAGYFVTWISTYTDGHGAVVGRQRFRIYKFDPESDRSIKPGHRAGPKAPNEAVGEELPPFDLDVTATVIVSGAIASRDFMPAHHDRDYATAQGAPDIFMNILATNGYVSRYITDWAGPEAMLRSISIRLGAPAVPGHNLRFTGRVVGEHRDATDRTVDVAVRATNDLGDHVTGTVALTVPLNDSGPRSTDA
jgi:uncharacterized protein